MEVIFFYFVFSIILSIFMSINIRKDIEVPFVAKIYPAYYIFSYKYLTKRGKIFWFFDIMLVLILIIYSIWKYIINY